MRSIGRKVVLQNLLAVVVFLGLTLAFYYPLFFGNKSLNQNDVFQGSAAGQELIEFREQTGEEGLWTNSMFGGMPGYLINTRWGDQALTTFQRIISFGMNSSAQVTFLSFLSFYILLLVFEVRPYLALAGAIAFGLTSFSMISIEAGHIWKVRAIAYMPLVLAGVHMVFRSPGKLFGTFFLALAIALEIQANHLQITYYLFLLLLIYGVNELVFSIREKHYQTLLRSVGLILIAVILGVGANFGKLWATAEYGQYSTRGRSNIVESGDQKTGLDREYVFNWSHGIGETFTLLVPNFYGGATQQALGEKSNLADALRNRGLSRIQINEQIARVPTYHGKQPFTSGPVYAGAIVIFLFMLGALLVDKKVRVWLIVAVIFSLLLSWGKNLEWFNYFFYDHFPGYSKFRSVSMAIIIALLAIPLLGFLGLEKLIAAPFSKGNQKKLLIALISTGGLALVFIVIAGIFNYSAPVDNQLGNVPEWYISAIRADRESLMRGDAFRSLFFILIFVVALYFYLKSKLSEKWFGVALVGLISLDLWLVDRRYVNDENFTNTSNVPFFQKTPADELILNDQTTHFRVFNLLDPWNEAKTSYYHSSIGGYHGAKMKRYQEFITYCLNDELRKIIEGLQSGNLDMTNHTPVNMLNARYLKFGNSRQHVLPNREAFGNAWLINNVKEVSSANEEMKQTCALESKQTAIINTADFELQTTELDTSGSVTLQDYQPNYLKYSFSGSGNSLVVFSEIYYPVGWTATIDGEKTPIFRANYLLRALEVPAGEHVIEFRFMPTSYEIGNLVMLICSLLVIAGFAIAIVLSFKDQKFNET